MATVTWVSDGDTIDVDTDRGTLEVRLLGVNTPEKGECFADEALRYLIDNLKGREVGLEIAETDQFGRTLASVWLGDELVNLALVENGLGIALTPGDIDPYGNYLLASEDRAYDTRTGLWSAEACGNSDPIPTITFDLGASQVNPPGPDDQVLDEEYIVIHNETADHIELEGWVLRDESSRNRLLFDGPLQLTAGEKLEISSGCRTDPSWCGDNPVWNNGGDMALLIDDSGRVVARARY